MMSRRNTASGTWLVAVGVLCLAGLGSPAVSASERELHIVAPKIYGLIESEGQGRYQLLLAEALKRQPFPVEQLFLPFKRALNMFREGKTDCIYTLSDLIPPADGRKPLLLAFPFSRSSFYLFRPAGMPALSRLAPSAKLRPVGLLGEGEYYEALLGIPERIEYVNSAEAALKMLALKRADVLIGALPDFTRHLPVLSYDPASPVVSFFDRMTCHDSAQGRAFIAQLSPILQAMKADGTYQRIMGDMFIDFEPPAPQ